MHSVVLQIYTYYYCPNIPGDLECVVQRLSDCIGEVKCWMVKHKLKINESKTEFIVALSPHNLKTCGLPQYLVADGVDIESVVCVRNLGTYFDIHMRMKLHVDAVCRKCNYHLRRIRSIRTYITMHVCHSFVIALVISSFDYCNALLLELPQYHLTRLQKMHNIAAPWLFSLLSLHTSRQYSNNCTGCLPYNALSLKYFCSFIPPEYLSHMLHPRTRQLYNKLQLAVTPASTSIGRRAFGVTGPIIWNELPLKLRGAPSLTLFKRHLKTLLCKRT